MNKDRWQLQYKKGIVELAIMLLINKKAFYGYELTATLNNTSYLRLSEGSVYPILKRLEKNKWSYSYWDSPEDSPRRKYYRLTDEGKKVLESRIKVFNNSAEEIYSIERSDGLVSKCE